MKIGIITLWQSSDNYGQQLQCWALQQILIKLGHNPFLIRYDVNDSHKVIHKHSIFKKVLKCLLVIPALISIKRKRKLKKEQNLKVYNSIRNKERNFELFRQKYLLLSSNVYRHLSELMQNPPEADAYITGSDQVWAYLLNNKENEVFFLNFGNKLAKRISYAPSFAMNQYPESLKERLKDNLSRFNALSVRELTGITICKDVGYKPQLVLDPTLLLDEQDYLHIEGDDNVKGKYIYLYYLNISEKEEIYWDDLKEVAKQKGLVIKATTATGYIQGRELFEDVEYLYATIPQWLGLIKNAALVVTTSFHGVVFCLIHHTPFIYIPLKGKYSRGNNRVLDLLKVVELNERVLDNGNDYSSIITKEINWQIVDEKIKVNQIKSIEFIKEALR